MNNTHQHRFTFDLAQRISILFMPARAKKNERKTFAINTMKRLKRLNTAAAVRYGVKTWQNNGHLNNSAVLNMVPVSIRRDSI